MGLSRSSCVSSCNSTASLQTGGGPFEECRVGMRRRCCCWLLWEGESGDVVDDVVDKDRRSKNEGFVISSIPLLNGNEEVHPLWILDLIEASLKYNLTLLFKAVRTEEKVMLIYQIRVEYFKIYSIQCWFEYIVVDEGLEIFLFFLVRGRCCIETIVGRR